MCVVLIEGINLIQDCIIHVLGYTIFICQIFFFFYAAVRFRSRARDTERVGVREAERGRARERNKVRC